MLLERERELHQIAELIELAGTGDGRVLAIEGAPGVGKTALLAAASQEAEARGLAVLTASGGELERDFAFGVVRQLFEPYVGAALEEDRAPLLAGAARLASQLWLDSPGALATQSDPVSPMLHAVYWLTVNLTTRGPLLISVDDVHWADTPSVRWLLYLSRRLDELPVLVALALRAEESDTEAELVSRIVSQPDVQVLRPRPLSESGVETLLRQELSTDPDKKFRDACHDATGGNPFLVRAVARELLAENVAPTAAAAERIGEIAPAPVSSAVRLRLARLPRAALALARAVAVLGSADTQQALTLADLHEAVAAEAADVLRAAGILRPSRELEFEHPLVRTAVYSAIPIGERTLAHARAAALLRGQDTPPERVAGHLLLADPRGEGWVVDALREAAAVALSRGAPESAVAYLQRAVAEPPPAEEGALVLRELGSAELRAQNPAAIGHLRKAFDANRDPVERGQIALELGGALVLADRVTEAVDLLGRAGDALGADHELALRLEATRILAGRQQLATRPLVLEDIARLSPHSRVGTAAERVLNATLAFEMVLAGEPSANVVEVAESALADGQLLAEESADTLAYYEAVHALVFADRLEAADQAFAAALDDARRRGSVLGFATASCFRADASYRRGAIADAEGDARASIEAAESHGIGILRPFAFGFLALPLIERGELMEAEQAVSEGGLGAEAPEEFHLNTLLYARGRLRIEQGEFGRGVEDLLTLGRLLDAWRVPNPAFSPWRSNAALGLVGTDPSEAVRLAHEEVLLARRFGSPGALGIAQRAAGLVSGGAEGLDLLREAAGLLERSGRTLELARARIDLGAALRRAGKRTDSREVLRSGLDLAHRCGATALRERARQELLAAGARPRRTALTGLEALTPSERRVAEIASRGLSNRDIAQALFVTTRTVEVHLSHVYRKLGIDGRADLPQPAAFV